MASLAIEEREKFLLRGVLAVSRQRTPSFEAYVKQDGVVPDIVLVNADDPAALQSWQKFASGAGKRCAGIMLTRERRRPSFRYVLSRPAGGRELLALLEKVAVEALGYTPPPAFDTDGAPVGAPSGAPSGKKGVRALVVDDSLPVRIQMQQALENIADEVDFAENGDDAIKLIDSHQYNIIFLDVVLPGSYNGYQICKAIKDKPERRNTPVIMLTSNSSPADRIKGKLAGCDTYLIKPVKQGGLRGGGQGIRPARGGRLTAGTTEALRAPAAQGASSIVAERREGNGSTQGTRGR